MRLNAVHSSLLLGAVVALAASGCAEDGTVSQMPEASGFFQVAEVRGRWMLITPDGEPFYSVGVNDVDPRGDTDRETGLCPYCEAVDRIYDSPEDWAEAAVARLRSWGFNTAGAWSEDER